MRMNKILKGVGAVVVLLLFLLFIGIYCPVQTIIGIPCPGCNMTTSLYYLLHGNIAASLYYHAMLIPTALLVLLVLYCRWKHHKKWIGRLVWLWIGCMVVYYIYRMIFIFPQMPMVYDSNSVLGRMFHIHF